jgi:hypothetical protein
VRAHCLIRREPWYRHDAFVTGLRAAGYEVHGDAPTFPAKLGDVMVCWNRYGHIEQIADRFEAEGGTVLVAENGYIQGRHDGGDYYALAARGHNGSGHWHVGGPERWNALGVELKPWRTEGKYILVAANRSFGMRGFAMPADWAERTADALRKTTKRDVRVRLHPGNGRPAVPLEHDLANAHCVVIWSSSVGVKALIEGIPVVCAAPWWICKRASHDDFAVAGGYMSDFDESREQAMHALAWAQWTTAEIASGEPFDYLLRATRQTEVATSA